MVASFVPRPLDPAPSPIEAHVAIGDGRSVALIDGAGAIDWLCWPRFDSAPIFASIVDVRRGGSFRIAPRGFRAPRGGARYLDDTNVAITRFEQGDAVVELVDAMTIDGDGTHERALSAEHELVRVVSCVRGDAEIVVTFDPRPDFGARRARVHETPRGTLRAEDRSALYTLRASRPLTWSTTESGARACAFGLRAGESVAIVLSFAVDAPSVLAPLAAAGHDLIETTAATWRAWAAKSRYDGPYRAAVVRSALALKLLCYAPSGAIIAAPTTSLPERRGGDRNWDYRFCWLRDAAFTARALLGLGHDEEADAFVGWLLHATHLTRPALRVLYDVFGEQPTKERVVESASGFGGARPVRIGNAAASQLQLDLHGEVVDAVAQAWMHGRPADRAEIDMVRELGEWVAENWRAPDQGIWEVRSEPQHHVHSRVSCWVALDRLLTLDRRGIAPLKASARERFAVARAAIADEVRSRGFSPTRGAYVSTLDGDRLDAALLLLSWYAFEGPASPRMRATFAAIDRELGVGRGLLRRSADLPDDGGFVACAFWAAEHLARGGGTLDEARARFEALLALASPSGLYGEIVEPAGGHLGNYPQGFSHLALLNAALSLQEREAREVRR